MCPLRISGGVGGLCPPHKKTKGALTFHATGGESSDEMFLEGKEEGHDGDGHEDCAGRKVSVLDGLGADILFEGDRQGVVDFVIHERRREDEFVPGGHEAEQGRDGDGGTRQGEDDRGENLEPRGAVDDGGLLELAWDRVKIPFEVPDTEWQRRHAVDEDQAEDVVGEAELSEDDVEGDHHDHAWEHLGDKERLESHLTPDEVKASEAVGGRAGKEYTDDGRDGRDDHGVPELVEEEVIAVLVGFENDVAEVVEGEGDVCGIPADAGHFVGGQGHFDDPDDGVENGDADYNEDEIVDNLLDDAIFLIQADRIFDPFLSFCHYFASAVESFRTYCVNFE